MKLLKPVKDESFFDYEEYCRICDNFHSLIHGCKDLYPKQARNHLDQAIIEVEKKLYFRELEKFRKLFE